MNTVPAMTQVDVPAKLHRMLIDGEWATAHSGQTIEVRSPVTTDVVAEVPRADAQDVDRAVKAAKRSQPNWSALPGRERGRALLAIADAIDAKAEILARSISLSGIAIRTQARPEANLCASVFRYFGGIAGEEKGETIPLGHSVLSYSVREPIGVVGAITPWNAPAVTVALKIAPAICAGNSVVVKLAEDAPLAGLELAGICKDLLPSGVVNVLTGLGAECGAALAGHPEVGKLSFTGSTATGKSIMRSAAERIAPVSLELGGKSPQVVFPDVASEEYVVDGVLAAMRFTRQTQSCSAGTRVFVHESKLDELVGSLVQKIKNLKIGDPFEEATDIGTLINERQFKKVCSYIDEGISTPGAKLVLGGLPPTEGPLARGYFSMPTIFLHNDNNWRLAQDEIFGPVMVVIPWRDEEDVIRMANESHYGLAAYIWSRDIGRALRTAHAIESGWVQINQARGQELGQSYGGFKQSGIGREFSLEGMLESFTQRKSITVNLQS